MRYAIGSRAALVFALAIGAGLIPAVVSAAPRRVNTINGIGLIDYGRKPNFRIGSWVKYHVTGRSELGMSDDYTVTIVIAGEETFWGERGFWVETWTELKDQPPNAVATLMSYAIFGDSLPIPHLQLFSRKMITNQDENGNPVEVVAKRNSGSLRGRSPVGEKIAFHIDTVGTESATCPKGTYDCSKVRIRQEVGSSGDVGDSTQRTEVHENRMVFMSDKVPITSIVREDIDNLIQRKSWKVGNSQDATWHVMEHSRGAAELVDFGVGLEPQLVPEKYRKPMVEAVPRRAAPGKTRAGKRRTG